MSEEAEKKEGEEGAEAPKKKSKKMLFIIIGAVVLLGGGGGAGFMLMGGTPPPEGEEGSHEEAHEAPKHFKIAEMEPFIVNLSESTSFLKVKLNIEYDQEIIDRLLDSEHGGHGGGGAGGGGEENPFALPEALKARNTQIRDAVIRVMSSKRAADVLTVEGKETLKQELIEAINEATGLEEGPVVNIYFSEFIIQ